MADNVTPIVRCPRSECNHPIDVHVGFESPSNGSGCNLARCSCQLTPNTIAVAAVHTALFGDLTPAPLPRAIRDSDGKWVQV